MKRYFLIVAVAATALVACTKTFDHNQSEGLTIGFGTWSDVMTKAPKTAFVDGDEFDVFGYKWMDAGTPAAASVFEGVDVEYDAANTKWSYSPLRYWDPSYDNYTFFAVWPKDILASGTYAQTGLFVTSELTFDGADEQLLIAQKNTVVKANYNQVVPLVFKHMGALVDIKVKKHTDIASAELVVTSIALDNIQTKGKFTVASYDGSNNPVGTAGVNGWELAATPVTDSYDENDGEGASLPTLAASTGTTTGTAGELINSLVVMPQALDGTQTLTITYTLEDESGIVNTYAPAAIGLDKFDNTDNKSNASTFITAWQPGYHYTLYVTINANAIEFSASIADWDVTTDGFHYLLN